MSDSEDERIDAAAERYQRAAHAVQSGVMFEIETDDGGSGGASTRKHLRVGINTAHVTDAAIARLLIARGICTLAEYTEAIADEMEAELGRYHERHPGVTFG